MKQGIAFFCCYIFFQTSWLIQNKPLQESIADGALIYDEFCVQCHLGKGEGVSGLSLIHI